MTMVEFVSQSLFYRETESEDDFKTTEIKRNTLGSEANKLLSSSHPNRAEVLKIESLYGEVALLDKQIGYSQGFVAGIQFIMEGAMHR